MRASWMVQATVNEPLELLLAFVAHYLEMGADLVHLHLDAPQPEAEAAFAGNPRVKVTLCDAAYWAEHTPRGRPIAHTTRQTVNARLVYKDLKQDWLLLCDADEYVVLAGDLGERLAAVSPGLDYVRLRVAEKVLPPDMTPDTVFEGVFRLPQPKGLNLAPEIYGPKLAPMLERVVAGHDAGKSIIRRGGDFQMQLHTPIARERHPAEKSAPPVPVGRWLPGAVLAHYDALTPLHYLIKLLGKHVANQAMAEAGRQPGKRHLSREAQIAFAVDACKSADPATVSGALHRLTPESMAMLKSVDLLSDLDLHPDATARKHFPGRELDYTPEAFDRALRVKHAEVLAKMGVA